MPKCFNDKYDFIDQQRHIEIMFKGLPEDMELFRKEFHATQDLSFNSFCLVWKRLRFAGICGKRHTVGELVEFVEGILRYCKGYIFGENLEASVFGFYTAYAIYNKQPITNLRSKLRLTIDELRTLKEIFQSMNDSQYDDVKMIFSAMCKMNAILFVAAELEAGMEYGTRKYFLPVENGVKITQSCPKNETSDHIDSKLFDNLREIFETYKTFKKLSFKDSEAFSSDSHFLEKITNCMEKMKEGPPVAESEDDNQQQEESDEYDFGQHRVLIKQNAFKRPATFSRTSDSPKKEEAPTLTKKRASCARRFMTSGMRSDESEGEMI